MITEDYVSFNIAKLLKEKGFNVYVRSFYDADDMPAQHNEALWDWNLNKENYRFSAPTLQIAMKWLREVHHYYIQVMLDSWALGSHTGYYVVIQKTDSDFEMMLHDVRERVFYDTPEEAAEDAIMYILENLI